MILKQSEIVARLRDAERQGSDPLFIVPCPFSESQLNGRADIPGAASVDLRLGTWFLAAQLTKVPVLEISKPSRVDLALEQLGEDKSISKDAIERLKRSLADKNPDVFAKSYHVRFGDDFVLHPRSFALAGTLEWIRIPSDLAGYVTGRSSWGRRGLIIATAVGVHPGFTGCMTLELANLGDLPIILRPGITICQLFLHSVSDDRGTRSADRSSFNCKRRPILGEIIQDEIALKLGRGYL